MTGGVNKHLYGCVSARVCCVYLCMYECETQMWHDHPLSQRNKKSKIAGGEGWKQQIDKIGQNFKKVGSQ